MREKNEKEKEILSKKNSTMGSTAKGLISGFICRLCSKMNRYVILIYGKEGQRMGLAEKINLYLPITVTRNDLLPKTVCPNCVEKLEKHSQMIQMITKAESKFNNHREVLSIQNREDGGQNKKDEEREKYEHDLDEDDDDEDDDDDDDDDNNMDTNTNDCDEDNGDEDGFEDDDDDNDDDDDDDKKKIDSAKENTIRKERNDINS